MRRSTVVFVGLGMFLMLAWGALARVEDKPADLAAAPPGFDARRENGTQGKIETVEYDSKSTGGKRKMVIYLPPGYAIDHKYPVFYLLHGAGDDETGW